MPIMATNTGAVMIIIHFSALPFHPHVLNFSEKNLTGLIISQLSTSTMSRNTNMALVVDRVPEEARRGGKWYIAVDYGTVNPTAAGLWCVWGGKAWMAAEYYYDSRRSGRRRTDEEHYREIEKLAGETHPAGRRRSLRRQL